MSANRAFFSRLAIGWILATVFHSGSVFSQENSTPGVDRPFAPNAPRIAGPPEHIIYLPFQRFADVWKNPDASVVIPYAEYLELWSHKLQEQTDERRPVDAVITEATYTATVAEDVARIRAELTVTSSASRGSKCPCASGMRRWGP